MCCSSPQLSDGPFQALQGLSCSIALSVIASFRSQPFHSTLPTLNRFSTFPGFRSSCPLHSNALPLTAHLEDTLSSLKAHFKRQLL